VQLQKLQFRPGLNLEGTDYSNEGGWSYGDKIRFRSGFPEKIGGWSQVVSATYNGVCRSLWSWLAGDLGAGASYLGVGTNTKYYIFSGGTYNDITPITQTSTLTNPFATNNGSPIVTVTDGTYTPNVGDFVIFSGGTAVGGLTISGEYQVASSVSSTQYTIQAASNATSTTTGGGTVTAQYEYPIGLNVYSVGTGWGAGPWSRGTWGSSYATGIGEQLRLWSNDNFGTDLVISPRGGPIFYWADSSGVSTRSQSITALANTTTALTDASTFGSGATSITVSSTAAPNVYPYMVITGTGLPANTQVSSSYVTGSTTVPITKTTTSASSGNYSFSYAGAFAPVATYQVITSAIQEFVLAFGSNSYNPNNAGTEFNPLLVRWSDQANPYQWIPIITNQSGEYQLTNGSYILCSRATRQEILIWTDTALYSMQYVGAPYVWGFQILMDNITCMSPNSPITVNNATYWMGRDRFYIYTGRVEVLPCTLKQYIFEDINYDQAYQVFSGTNNGFNEIWWCYISKNSGGTVVDKYVVYNYLDRVWYYGTWSTYNPVTGNFDALNGRSAWIQSGMLPYPVAADYNNRLLYHESGTDDNATSTTYPIYAYAQSSDFDIGDGHNFGFVWRILPDINFNGSTVNNPYVTMTITPRYNSGTPYGVADTPQVISAQNYTNVSEYQVQQFTGQVYTRLRGRQMCFRIESNSIGAAWQLGTPRISVRPDGRR